MKANLLNQGLKITIINLLLSFYSRKRILPFPLNLYGSLVHFGWKVKYVCVYLGSTLYWRKHIEYSVYKFYKAKNDLSELMYTDVYENGKQTVVI